MLNLPAHSGRKPDRSGKRQKPIKMIGKWHYLEDKLLKVFRLTMTI